MPHIYILHAASLEPTSLLAQLNDGYVNDETAALVLSANHEPYDEAGMEGYTVTEFVIDSDASPQVLADAVELFIDEDWADEYESLGLLGKFKIAE